MSATSSAGGAPRRWVWMLPLVLFLALAGLFFLRLYAGDPSRLPSALIGKPAPQTPLPPLPGLVREGKPVPGIDATTLQASVSLVNVWASWCAPCHEEMPLLNALARDPRLKMVGINQKDAPENALRFLGRYGNPFAAVGVDRNGRASIEWGVYGVPETFIVDRNGVIVFKLVGGITPENIERALKPAIAQASAN